jgi:hypothetical protein
MPNTQPLKRGRKPSFKTETVPVLTHIPERTKNMLARLAKAREDGRMNAALDQAIREAYARFSAERKQNRPVRKAKAVRSAAPVTAEVSAA